MTRNTLSEGRNEYLSWRNVLSPYIVMCNEWAWFSFRLCPVRALFGRGAVDICGGLSNNTVLTDD